MAINVSGSYVPSGYKDLRHKDDWIVGIKGAIS